MILRKFLKKRNYLKFLHFVVVAPAKLPPKVICVFVLLSQTFVLVKQLKIFNYPAVRLLHFIKSKYL